MALEPIQYTTHSREIEQEYQKVVRGTDADTTWLIISPDAQKEYGPSSTGSDFSDFIQSFDDGKVEYGIASVSPLGSDVRKVLLVGWCPDSAPMKTRASFAANFGTVANDVLPGYHVQVSARDEDDLDKQDLLTKISNAAGARYSIQAKTASTPATTPSPAPKKKVFTPTAAPVSSPAPVTRSAAPAKRDSPPAPAAATKTTPASAAAGDDDWDEPEIQERDFQQQPLAANTSSYTPVGKVDLKRVIAEEQAREDPRLVGHVDPSKDIASLKHDAQVSRDRDLDNLLQQEKQPRAATKPPVVKPDFSRGPADSGKVIQGFKTEKSPAQLWAEKKRLQNQQESGDAPATTEAAAASSPASAQDSGVDHSDEMKIGDLKSRFEKLGAQDDQEEKPVQRTTPAAAPEPKTFGQPAPGSVAAPAQETKKPFVPGNVGQRLPGMHSEVSEHEDNNDDDDDWGEDEQETPKRNLPPPVAQARNVPPPPARAAAPEQEEPEEEEAPAPSLPSRGAVPPPPQRAQEPEEEEEEEEAPAPSLPSRNAAPEPEQEEPEEPEEEEAPAPSLPSRGAVPPPPQRAQEPAQEEEAETPLPWATAEYDYEAGEDNELTFSENDKIINIEFVDDDWWLGELESSGEKGLFPSNYVVLGN